MVIENSGNIHTAALENREHMKITGVSEVLSFDDKSVVLSTKCGGMAVDGNELRVTVLNTAGGIVELTGKINGLYYYDKPEKNDKKSGWKKLFG